MRIQITKFPDGMASLLQRLRVVWLCLLTTSVYAGDAPDECFCLVLKADPVGPILRGCTWIGTEPYSTQAEQVRRQLVVSESTFQDVALSLALQEQTLNHRRHEEEQQAQQALEELR